MKPNRLFHFSASQLLTIGMLLVLVLADARGDASQASRDGVRDRPSGTSAKDAVQSDLQRTTDHFELLARRLQESKLPRTIELLDKVRSLLIRAKLELDQNHLTLVHDLLNQVESLFPELGRLAEQIPNQDKYGLPESFQDGYQNQQPAARVAMAQATETYHRVYDHLSRLRDQNKLQTDPNSNEQLIHIQDLLEKCREALASGHAEAAKGLGIKAEAQLTEWHQITIRTGGDPLRVSASALERLKTKIDKATEIIRTSGNEKAQRILEKSLEHLERAERGKAENQAVQAQVEMDIALKLAAKAVDIARSSQSR